MAAGGNDDGTRMYGSTPWAGGAVVAGNPTVVEVLGLTLEGGVATDVEVVCCSTNFTRSPSTLPGKASGTGKSPPSKRGSRVARDMKRWKIVAGNEPPLTFM